VFEQKELFKRALQEFNVSPTAQLLGRLTDLLRRQSGRKVVVNSRLEVVWKGDLLLFVSHSSAST
jgi:hypothetical protein